MGKETRGMNQNEEEKDMEGFVEREESGGGGTYSKHGQLWMSMGRRLSRQHDDGREIENLNVRKEGGREAGENGDERLEAEGERQEGTVRERGLHERQVVADGD